MNDKKKAVERELLTILEEAILEEQASTVRYRHGAKLATDPHVRTMFERLAEDEIKHEQALKEQYYKIKKQLGLKLLNEQ